ncbi:MAG: mechanosensitive ion channel family protein [Acidobacteriota bacterium]|nr:MAG: mechanosensitive ion channel family protein [Acidobacteriota bacterium]
MRRYTQYAAPLLIVLLCLFLPLSGQETAQEDVRQETEPVYPPLSASDIPSESEEVSAFLQIAGLKSKSSARVTRLESELPDLRKQTSDLEESTKRELQAQPTMDSIQDLEAAWRRRDGLLRGWLEDLVAEGNGIDESLSQIQQRVEQWEDARGRTHAEAFPSTIRENIRQTLDQMSSTGSELRRQRTRLLTLQNEVVGLRSIAQESLNKIRSASEQQLAQLLAFDGPSLWSVPRFAPHEMASRLSDEIKRDYLSLQDYFSKSPKRFVFDLILLCVMIGFLFILKRAVGERLADRPELNASKYILTHPISSAIVVTALVTGLLHGDAPAAWFKCAFLVTGAALAWLLPGMVQREVLSVLYFLLGFRILELFNGPIPGNTALGFTLTLTIASAAFVATIWFRRRIKETENIPRQWTRLMVLGSWIANTTLGASLITASLGGTALSKLLTSHTIRNLYLALLFWVGVTVVRGMLVVLLKTEQVQELRSARLYHEVILRRASRIIGGVAILLWLLLVGGRITQVLPIGDAFRSILTTPLEVGEISISTADVLIFALSIWLSFKIARFICFVLDEDFLPRLSLPRGVPATISRLSYYVVLFLGFLVAVSAAGLDLSRFALLAGAFGVGIGFGLQNIVNNFVSGLILLFERPIQIGDKIQAGQLTGEVVRIGTRSSTIRTFDGAEVIVPNGNLISNEVINWTLSDMQRRVELPIGVAYGTDPERVISLLLEVAKAHPMVLSHPEPAALFMGFGESSLDFSLRAWVGTFDVAFVVRSELAVAVNKALAEANIEIPFPQRDLHLRSVDRGATIEVESVKPTRKSTDKE